MKYNDSFAHSDLAYEKRTVLPSSDKNWQRAHGIDYSESNIDGVRVATLEISSDEGAELMGKPRGRYVTVFCGRIRSYEEDAFEKAAKTIADCIRSLLLSLTEKKEDICVLVVGLGNRAMTADAIGPETTDRILVTRHLKSADRELWSTLGVYDVSAFAPGVLGQTGIETVELVKGASNNVAPDVIIAVDALAARSLETLASTVQLSNTGIEPGSGIGNKRRAIDRASLGVPVLSIGVPTVVDSSTLVYDALKKAGVEDIGDELTAVLENGRGFFVSPKDTDVICGEMASLLAKAIDTALSHAE